MALSSRISPLIDSDTDPPQEPEDYLSTSLGVIFPDDATIQHGEAGRRLVYTSPDLSRPVTLLVPLDSEAAHKGLFADSLWNAALLLAELMERDTLAKSKSKPASVSASGPGLASRYFDVSGLKTVELGAGTGLPSIVAGLLGAKSVTVTDFPSPGMLDTLEENLRCNLRCSETSSVAAAEFHVHGHLWGDVSSSSSGSSLPEGAFDRVLLADCLWMPHQHANLHRSVDFLLPRTDDARCWVVAGFHTGRRGMRGFFAPAALAQVCLEVEAIWERDCDGLEREWDPDADEDDHGVRKRWLVVAVLKRLNV